MTRSKTGLPFYGPYVHVSPQCMMYHIICYNYTFEESLRNGHHTGDWSLDGCSNF